MCAWPAQIPWTPLSPSCLPCLRTLPLPLCSAPALGFRLCGIDVPSEPRTHTDGPRGRKGRCGGGGCDWLNCTIALQTMAKKKAEEEAAKKKAKEEAAKQAEEKAAKSVTGMKKSK